MQWTYRFTKKKSNCTKNWSGYADAFGVHPTCVFAFWHLTGFLATRPGSVHASELSCFLSPARIHLFGLGDLRPAMISPTMKVTRPVYAGVATVPKQLPQTIKLLQHAVCTLATKTGKNDSRMTGGKKWRFVEPSWSIPFLCDIKDNLYWRISKYVFYFYFKNAQNH